MNRYSEYGDYQNAHMRRGNGASKNGGVARRRSTSGTTGGSSHRGRGNNYREGGSLSDGRSRSVNVSERRGFGTPTRSDIRKGEMDALAAERDMLKERVEELETQVSEITNHKYGRNNTVKRAWRDIDLANMDNLSKWLKMNLFPMYKFLPTQWWDWTPKVERSLSRRIQRVVKCPAGCEEKFYWESKVVSMVNKKYVEMRSNINGACRKEYMKSELRSGGK